MLAALGLKLVPDWPLSSRPQLLADIVEPNARRQCRDPGWRALCLRPGVDPRLCAWGKPSDAFGPMYARFDAPGRVPRLPGPPYLFMSRVTKTSGEIGGMEVGSTVEVEYDIPADAWYFAENGARTMPYAYCSRPRCSPAAGSRATSALRSPSKMRSASATSTAPRPSRPSSSRMRERCVPRSS